MTQNTSGKKAKAKIIKACRKLFYEKGFDETTYNDISNETGILPGSIAYHFKSKENLYRAVFNAYSEELYDFSAKLTKEVSKDKPYITYIMGIYLAYYRQFTDDKLRRFLMVTSEKSMFSPHEYYEDYLRNFEPVIHVRADSKFYIFDLTACSGADDGFVRKIFSNIEQYKYNFTYMEVAEYAFRLMSKFFDCDTQKLDEAIKIVNAMLDNIDLSGINGKL